ncbi:MAG: hypothetical protein HC889_14150 [Synechococcaceae cyanobacterium SM1_2_3]|nr:hypothetical protein [Synechococcaceae cyanobacterium SM1_2_3]
MHQPVTVAGTHNQEFMASVAEHAIAGRPFDFTLKSRIQPIRFGQRILSHPFDTGAFLGGGVSLRLGATSDQQNT